MVDAYFVDYGAYKENIMLPDYPSHMGNARVFQHKELPVQADGGASENQEWGGSLETGSE